jgi:hypothetical protein
VWARYVEPFRRAYFVSRSGTRHIDSGRMVNSRLIALCEFTKRIDDQPYEWVKDCPFCEAEAEAIEHREQLRAAEAEALERLGGTYRYRTPVDDAPDAEAVEGAPPDEAA